MSVLSVHAKLQIEIVIGKQKDKPCGMEQIILQKTTKFFVVSMIEKKHRNKQFLINDDDIEMVQSCCFFFTSLSFTFIVVSSIKELHVSPLVKPAHPERRLSARPLFAGSSLI